MHTNLFWGEIAPCEHLLQVYDGDDALLDSLEGFIRGGLEAGEGIILIATPKHVRGIEQRLWKHDVDIELLQAHAKLILHDADSTLRRFMRGGLPDESLFRATVEDLLSRVNGWQPGSVRRIRAFGEMVAILWAEGRIEATVELEHLWHRFCAEKGFSLFCAYPKLAFTDAQQGLADIVAAHSRFIQPPPRADREARNTDREGPGAE